MKAAQQSASEERTNLNALCCAFFLVGCTGSVCAQLPEFLLSCMTCLEPIFHQQQSLGFFSHSKDFLSRSEQVPQEQVPEHVPEEADKVPVPDQVLEQVRNKFGSRFRSKFCSKFRNR